MILFVFFLLALLILYFFGFEVVYVWFVNAIAKLAWFLIWVGFFTALGACVGAILPKIIELDLIFVGSAIGFICGVYTHETLEDLN